MVNKSYVCIMPNSRKTNPPAKFTVFSDILLANNLPPTTAIVVHNKCPTIPPKQTISAS